VTTSAPAGRRQWAGVLAVALVLGIATYAAVRYLPTPAGVQVGQRAPDFRIRDLRTGDTISLRKRYAGHVTLVNLWATWCHPCEKEMPSLQQLYASYEARGFRVAAASIDEGDAASVLAYAASHQLTFDILHDRTARIGETFQSIGVPESFLLDRSGRIVYIALGAETWDSPAHRVQVEKLLGAP
jgi:peroxiredoxin